MKPPVSVTASRMARFTAGLLLSALVLGACVLVGPQVERISAVPGEALPVDAPIAFVELRPRTGPLFNAQGGEIPRTVPQPRVEQGELEEIPATPRG